MPSKNSVSPKYERTDKFNQNRNQPPPIETRNREQSNQKRIGAPVQKTKSVQQQQRTNPSKGKVTESKKNTNSAPTKTEKSETLIHRGN